MYFCRRGVLVALLVVDTNSKQLKKKLRYFLKVNSAELILNQYSTANPSIQEPISRCPH